MFTTELVAPNQDIKLIRPDIERDAPLSVQWLTGATGRETLRLMGIPDKDNHGSTLELECERIGSFLADNSELDWMIEYNGHVVGAIWVHTKPTEYISAPAVSLMIGDPSVRGKGIGRNALRAAINWLFDEHKVLVIYARHLTTNVASQHLLHELAFQNDGQSYFDNDGLHWQNVQLQSQ